MTKNKCKIEFQIHGSDEWMTCEGQTPERINKIDQIFHHIKFKVTSMYVDKYETFKRFDF